MKVKSEPRLTEVSKETLEESNERNSTIITKENEGEKVGSFIRNYFSHLIISKSQSHLACKQGQVLINGKPARGFETLNAGDVVKVTRKIEETLKYKEGFKVDIRYEDDEMAVVWKPSGTTLNNQLSSTLEIALKYNLKPSNSNDKLENPKCVSLLDKATPGFVIAAKTESSYNVLVEDLKKNSIVQTYMGIVHGRIEGNENEKQIISSVIDNEECITEYAISKISKTRNGSGYLTTVLITPKKGYNRFQPRKHMIKLGHPIIGNTRYTKQIANSKDKGLYLTLTSLYFQHPKTKENMSFTSPEPTKFNAIRAKEEKFWKRKQEEELLLFEKALDSFENSDQDNKFLIDHIHNDQRPTPYILGEKEFFGNLFYVNENCLIPRKATEVLVQATIDLKPHRILDLGTGSGCILLSCLKNINNSQGVGIDLSDEILELANKNKEALLGDQKDNAKFIKGDFSSLSENKELHRSFISEDEGETTYFDVVVCNPPYLTEKEIKSFSKSIQYEPQLALLGGGEKGIHCYEQISEFLQKCIDKNLIYDRKKTNYLVLEIPPNKGKLVIEHCFNYLKLISIKNDEKNLKRCLVYELPPDTNFIK
ncbi:S-adenosyl-L-methionine-dependent methyltransferase [Piromyces finnis]|uniref:S-adenosyl-L-methionine-dependent methyltransferase n=1 Tax=Piromyces finnis TaxID=1754191 RepID=A0A1Y1V9I4_9FUNG|nr:S-adenosyl-L-methionine-dependent methyltransferase [Piromyces finnis]|eukprot:ORX49252.1 S-adenosyl-L-methionine-dependent methyltransferase [Piromyces finnis]